MLRWPTGKPTPSCGRIQEKCGWPFKVAQSMAWRLLSAFAISEENGKRFIRRLVRTAKSRRMPPVRKPRCRPLCYGKKGEERGLELYEKKNNIKLAKPRILLNPTIPFLMVSPDGVEISNGKIQRVIEIKSPLRGRTEPVNEYRLDKALPGDFKYEMYKYFQLQMSLAITNTSEAILCFYSEYTDDIKEIIVTRDDNYILKNLQAIEHIYKRHLLPLLRRIL